MPLTQKFETTSHPCLYENKAEAGSPQAGCCAWKTMCCSHQRRFPGPSQVQTGKTRFGPKTTASLTQSSWSSKHRQPKNKTKHKSRLRIGKNGPFPTLWVKGNLAKPIKSLETLHILGSSNISLLGIEGKDDYKPQGCLLQYYL